MDLSEEQIRKSIAFQIQKKLTQKINKNPRYSLRALARDLGVSPAFVSLCLRGKKKVSFNRALQLAKHLKMTKSEVDILIKLMTLLEIKNRKQKEDFILRNHQTDWEIIFETRQTFKILEKWYYLPILELTTLPQFVPSHEWIADRLSLSPYEVKSAIEKLLEAGFLKKQGAQLIKTHSKMQIPTQKSYQEIRDFHLQMIHKAQQKLQQTVAPGDFHKRDFSGATFTADTKKLREAKKMITEFRHKLADFLMDGSGTEVYQLNIQLFSLTQSMEKIP